MYTLSTKYRGKGIIKSRYNLKSNNGTSDQTPNSVSDSEVIVPLNFEEINDDYHWLKKNVTPEQTVLEKWQKTFDLRKQHYQNADCNMLQDWPILAQKIGTTLVSFTIVQYLTNCSYLTLKLHNESQSFRLPLNTILLRLVLLFILLKLFLILKIKNCLISFDNCFKEKFRNLVISNIKIKYFILFICLMTIVYANE